MGTSPVCPGPRRTKRPNDSCRSTVPVSTAPTSTLDSICCPSSAPSGASASAMRRFSRSMATINTVISAPPVAASRIAP